VRRVLGGCGGKSGVDPFLATGPHEGLSAMRLREIFSGALAACGRLDVFFRRFDMTK
jgi:hypothetical protein